MTLPLLPHPLILSTLILATALPLSAVTRTWDGGGSDNNWSTPENWIGDVAPSAGDSLVFAGKTRLETVNDYVDGTAFLDISFADDAGAFRLSGNRLRLGDSGGPSQIVETTEALTPVPIILDLDIEVHEGLPRFRFDGPTTVNGMLTESATINSNPDLWYDFTGGNTVTLTHSGNDFNSGLGVQGGTTVAVDHLADSGQASQAGAGYFFKLGNAGSTGKLVYQGGEVSTDRRLLIGGGENNPAFTGGAILINDGYGPLHFTHPNFSLNKANTTAPRELRLGGQFSAAANSIAGIIADHDTGGGGINHLRVTGGFWRLGGANSYTGTTSVEGGTLLIDGDQSAATGAVAVATGARFGGRGTVGGDCSVEGMLLPGEDPGSLTFRGDLLLAASSRTEMEFASASLYDRLSGGNSLTVAEGATIAFDFSAYSPADGTRFQVFDGWTSYSGDSGRLNFEVSGLPEGLALDAGNLFRDGTIRLRSLAISEDFDGSEFGSLWQQDTPADWTVSEGLATRSTESGLEQLYQYRESAIFTDFHATVRFKVTSGTGWVGLGFSKLEPDLPVWGTGYNLLLNSAGKLTLNARNESTQTSDTISSVQTGASPLNNWMELSVEKLGDSIRVWVDGVLQLDLQDGSWPAGYLSFNFFNMAGQIDSFTVRPLGDLPYKGFARIQWALETHSDSPGEYTVIEAAHPVEFAPVRFLELDFSNGIDWSDAFWNSDRSWLVLDAHSISNPGALRLLTEDWVDAGGDHFADVRAGRLFSLRHTGKQVWLDYTAPATREIHVAKTGDDGNPGTEAHPYQTISKAALEAMPGDSVIVHAGTYREQVKPSRGGFPGLPVTYRAANGDSVTISGSEHYSDWTQVSGETWQRSFNEAEFNGYNPYLLTMDGAWLDGERSGTVNRRRGEVFLDGQPLEETEGLASVQSTPGSWAASPDGLTVYANFGGTNPNDALAEIVLREQIFAPESWNLGFIHVKDFILEHAANNLNDNDFSVQHPTMAALSTNGGHDWLIEGNTIRHTKSFGVGLGLNGPPAAITTAGWNIEPARYGHHVFRGNTVRDVGSGGIHAYKGPFCLIDNNRFIRCNRLVVGGSEKAAVKFVWFGNDLLIRNNYFYKNNLGSGFSAIWLDAGTQGARISGNVFVDNDYVWFERQHGPVVFDNNVMINTNFRISDGGGVLMAHNLISRTALEDPENDYFRGGVGNNGTDSDPSNNLTRYDSFGYIETAFFQPHTLNHWGDALTQKTDLHWHNNLIVGDLDQYLPPEDANTYDNFSDFNVFLDGASPSLQDANSIVAAQATNFSFTADEYGVELNFDVPGNTFNLQAPYLNNAWIGNLNRHVAHEIEPISHDFHGGPINLTSPVAGPFAGLNPGNQFYAFDWNPMANTAPTFQAGGITVPDATTGGAYSSSLAATAIDRDIGDSLSFRMTAGPDWLSVATDGSLSGTPDTGDIGQSNVTVQVEDSNGAIDSISFTLLVRAPQTKPNIIVFMAGDFGWTGPQYHPELFPQGSEYYETPHLEALAENGVVLHHARSLPLPAASQASLLSGQYAARLDYSADRGVAQPDYIADNTLPLLFPESINHLYESVTTLADYLKEIHGYHNWHVGKWKIGNADATESTAPVQRGFDRQFFVKDSLTHHFGPFDAASGIEDVVYPDGSSAVGSKLDHNAETLTRIATELIADHAGGAGANEPFYLNLFHYVAEGPIEARQADIDYFTAKDTDPQRGHDNPYYASMVRYLDDSLGALIQTLKDNGEYDDTLFIFYSGNGGPDALSGGVESFAYDPSTGTYTSAGTLSLNDNWPLDEGKSSVREGGTRVPAVISFPASAIGRGVRLEEAVHLVDLFPTLLDYLSEPGVSQIVDRDGFAQPLDGLSLRPLLEGGSNFPERSIFSYWPEEDRWAASVVHDDYKLIRWYLGGHQGASRADLFDLLADPGETINLASLMPELALDLLGELDSWVQSEAGHPPLVNPNYDGLLVNQPDTSYYQWLFRHLPHATPGQRHPDADLDLDGRSNLEEFLVGGDPLLPETLSPLAIARTQTGLEVQFQVPLDREATTHRLMESIDLVDWNPVPEETLETVGTNGFGDVQLGELQRYRLGVSHSGAPDKKFYRLVTTHSETVEIGRRSGFLADTFTYGEAGSGTDTAGIADTRLATGTARQVLGSDLAGILAGRRYTLSLDLSWEDPTDGSSSNQVVWGGLLPGGSAFRQVDAALQFAIDVDNDRFEVGFGDGVAYTTAGSITLDGAPLPGGNPNRFYPLIITIDETGSTPRIESVQFDGQVLVLANDSLQNLDVDRSLVFNTSGSLIFLVDNLELRLADGTLLYRDNFNSPDSTHLNLE